MISSPISRERVCVSYVFIMLFTTLWTMVRYKVIVSKLSISLSIKIMLKLKKLLNQKMMYHFSDFPFFFLLTQFRKIVK